MYGLFSLRHVGFSSPTRGCWLKRCTIWEFWVKFYLGQNQDCSPGAGTSDSSERLLQRGSRTRSIYDFGEVGVQCSQALALQKVFCWSEGADVTLNGFSAFLHMKRCKDWDHLKRSNYINICSTRFPGAQSASLHPELTLGEVLKVDRCSSTGSTSTETDGKCLCYCRSVAGKCFWQVPVCSWQDESWLPCIGSVES